MSEKLPGLEGEWALVLGASSGFGAATCRELARQGMNIAGVHLDRKSTMPAVEELIADVRAQGVEADFHNVNAADPEKRAAVADALAETFGPKPARVILHSIAFGTLKPLIAEDAKASLSQRQIEMTLDVMASSLVYWVQEMSWRGLVGEGSRVLAMTSAGSTRCWPSYGAVSAAKAALESYIRQLAVELAPRGATANSIRAGVTDTPALRKIPGNDAMIERVLERHPAGRLTQPEDVARFIALLATSGAGWVSGNVLGVDGAEDVIS